MTPEDDVEHPTTQEEYLSGLSAIRLGTRARNPLRKLARRVFLAVVMLLLVVAIVYADRRGYRDAADGGVDLVDALYYATVSLSTTGYGDITPVSTSARLINVFLITPLRIAFLIILVGTTVEALADSGTRQFRVSQWRKKMHDHTIVIGYGVKGRAAVKALIAAGVPRSTIIVIDPDEAVVKDANARGMGGVLGDATRERILKAARIEVAQRVIVATARDDTATLVTLTARKLNPTALIVASVRETENSDLLRNSGANQVLTSASSAGRMLGIAAVTPAVSEVVSDLLTAEAGLSVHERPVRADEVGRRVAEIEAPVLGVVRHNSVLRFYNPLIGRLAPTDRLVVAQETTGPAAGPRRARRSETVSPLAVDNPIDLGDLPGSTPRA